MCAAKILLRGLVGALALSACSRTTRHADQAPDSARSRPDSTATAKPELQWRIVPGRAAGMVTAGSTEADLRRAYGTDSVSSARIDLGEGETAPGAVLFPSDSLRRLEILWQDTLERARPTRLILRGARSRWQLNGGISLGTSLQDLERLNGRPFKLAGFGWDYSGVVFEWSGGALDSTLVGVKLYLDPGPASYESAPYKQVLGDAEYSSALAPMQQLSPKVYQIFVDLQ